MRSVIQFFLQNKFRKEITLAILVKLLALFVLWQLFFSHPVSKQIDHAALISHYLFS